MTKVALFLGAGASRAFGYPLTSEILPLIRRRISSPDLFGPTSYDAEQRLQLHALLTSILPGMDRVEDERLPIITDILSLVDYSILSASVAAVGQPRHELLHLRKLLERAIVDILECPYESYNVPAKLQRFADWIQRRNQVPDSVSVISANYDISLDLELFKRLGATQIAREFDFGFEWRDPAGGSLRPRPVEPRCRIYKIHGSVNWLRCPLCDHVYVNVHGSIIHQAFKPGQDDFNTCDCDYHPLEPVIVAPSTIRDVRDSNLLEIWRHTLEVLRGADEWVLIGYSFPPEDVAIRSMFLRAFSARKRPPDIRVIQHGSNPATEARYRVFFPECRYESGGMEAFVDGLAL
jgi:hypothetical protein